MQYTKNKKYYGDCISIFARQRIYFSYRFPLCLTVIVRPIVERGSTRTREAETSQRFHLSVVHNYYTITRLDSSSYFKPLS